MDHENRGDRFLCSFFFFFQYLEEVISWKTCSLLFLKDARTSYVDDNIILFFLCLRESITACAVIFVNVLVCFLGFLTHSESPLIRVFFFVGLKTNNTCCRSCRFLKLSFYCNEWKVGANSGHYSSSKLYGSCFFVFTSLLLKYRFLVFFNVWFYIWFSIAYSVQPHVTIQYTHRFIHLRNYCYPQIFHYFLLLVDLCVVRN